MSLAEDRWSCCVVTRRSEVITTNWSSDHGTWCPAQERAVSILVSTIPTPATLCNSVVDMEWTNDARVVRVWCGLKAAVLVRMNGKMERSQNLIKGICRTFQHIEKILTLCGNILHKYIHVHVFTIKYLPHIAIDILISRRSAAAWRRQVCGQWSARHVTRDTAWRRCCTWPLAVTQLVQWCGHLASHTGTPSHCHWSALSNTSAWQYAVGTRGISASLCTVCEFEWPGIGYLELNFTELAKVCLPVVAVIVVVVVVRC